MPTFIIGALVCMVVLLACWLMLGRELGRSMKPMPGDDLGEPHGNDR